MHLQVCDGEEKERETHAHARSSHLTRPSGAWQGEVRRWARAHDVHVNSPSKSDAKPHRSTTSFYHLFFYECVSNTF
jgi:hypothetical protein